MPRTDKLSSLSIFMPAYNEESDIVRVIKEIQGVMKETKYSLDILVIDDGSSDDTVNIWTFLLHISLSGQLLMISLIHALLPRLIHQILWQILLLVYPDS